MWNRLYQLVEVLLLLAMCTVLLNYSTPHPSDDQDRVRTFTRGIEFDYLSWMLNAMRVKLQQEVVGFPEYLDNESCRILVSDYLQGTQNAVQAESAIERIYADPSVTDKVKATAYIRNGLNQLNANLSQLIPLAEAVLQSQVTQVLADAGLSLFGQPIPSVLYHTTTVPDALIISPRDRIEQSANISLQPGLPVERQDVLEDRVERGLDMAALVVPIGGVGVYPTMIMRTTDLNWLTSTIAHEWTHNFLELRPLGLRYDVSPELRTMNETTADIVGNEIGKEVMHRYYPIPQLASLPDNNLVKFLNLTSYHDETTNPPFDFRGEMHATRVQVDEMLASGRIVEAEKYMEQRRQLFVQNGYFLRKLNQAYFAFYGAYAETPGGPAGEDPVGPAVRELRARSPSLAAFVNRISWMTSFQQLQNTLN